MTSAQAVQSTTKAIDFGLFFFASVEAGDAKNRYRGLLEAAKYADTHGFGFVSTPERHFNRFGGLFPNPVVIASAIAALTSRVQIRAGSLISPIHNPLRIVEDWSVVDNISNGRVAVSFGSGWNINDFVFAPSHYYSRREIMHEQIEEVRRLWREGRCTVVNPSGTQVDLHIYPRPVQTALPVWLTSSGNADTFRAAGRLGANILTHMENQDLQALREKIDLYRSTMAEHGHDSRTGKITVMQHTYVATTTEEASRLGGEALRRYLAAAVELEETAIRGGGGMSGNRPAVPLFDRCARQDVIEHAAHKYQCAFSLIGSVAECKRRVHELRAIGVDEIACLIDFVDDEEVVMRGLECLDAVQKTFAKERTDADIAEAVTRFNGAV